MNVPKLRFPEFTEEWESRELGEMYTMQAGKFINASKIQEENSGSLYPCYGGNGLRGYLDRYNQEGNYPLIGRQGALCGNVTLAKNKFYATEHAIVVGMHKNVDVLWSYYLLDRMNLNQYSTGLAQPGLSVQNLLKLETFASPILQEQQKIASFLTTVDDKIRMLKQKKELLEDYKKGVMQQIFSRKLRFRDENGEEFPDWEKQKLKEVFLRKTTKNKDNHISTVLTNSATKGIVLQEDYFDRDIANNENLQGYYIVELDDFVYNPRISATAPVGPLKRNKTSIGVMSPLYTILKPQKGSLSFFEHYFSASLWHKYMFGIANYGARHDRMNITIEDFENMPLPFPSHKEQQKIASFLTALDDKIGAIGAQIEGMEAWKKGLLQRMFV